MGRKKKVIEDKQATTIDSFKYQGNLKVSITNGKSVLSTKHFKNTGYNELFKFLCECLAGNYDSSTRPCRIVFYGLGDSTDTPDNPDMSTARIATTFAVGANTAAVTTKVDSETENSYYVVTYHFLVPFAYIKGTNTVNLYKAALLKDRCNLDYVGQGNDELCARFTFSNKDTKAWTPIEIDKNKTGNYSVIIEWELRIKN